MSYLYVEYCYPCKRGLKYERENDHFFVSEENILEIVSEPNEIDFICDAMKLVLLEKCKDGKPNETIVNFLLDVDSFNDDANTGIIEIYPEIQNDSKNERVNEEFVRSRSEALTNRFIEIYNNKLWKK